MDQPASTSVAGVAIFAGHGTNEVFEISHNFISNCPIDGIQVYNRSFVSEITLLIQFNVNDNIILQPGWAGVAVYGGLSVKVQNNHILNPGFAGDTHDEKRCGIYLSNQVSGGSNFALQKASVTGNTMLDMGGTPTMRYGVFESTFGGPGVTDGTGVITDNTVSGNSSSQYSVYGGLAVHKHDISTRRWGLWRCWLLRPPSIPRSIPKSRILTPPCSWRTPPPPLWSLVTSFLSRVLQRPLRRHELGFRFRWRVQWDGFHRARLRRQ